MQNVCDSQQFVFLYFDTNELILISFDLQKEKNRKDSNKKEFHFAKPKIYGKEYVSLRAILIEVRQSVDCIVALCVSCFPYDLAKKYPL